MNDEVNNDEKDPIVRGVLYIFLFLEIMIMCGIFLIGFSLGKKSIKKEIFITQPTEINKIT